MVSSKSDITVSRGLKVRLPYTKIGVCHGRAGIHQSVGKVHTYNQSDYKIPPGPSASVEQAAPSNRNLKLFIMLHVRQKRTPIPNQMPEKRKADFAYFKTKQNLLIRNLDLTRLDIIRDIFGATPIDLTSNREGGTKNLLHGALELTGQGLLPHDSGNIDNLIEGNRLAVLDVLLLLAVTRRLLESLDDEGRRRRNDRDGRLTVLDAELDSDAESFPVTSSLGNIFTDLLG